MSEREGVTLVLNAHLRHFNGGEREAILPRREGKTLGDYLSDLGITPNEYAGFSIEGELTDDLSIIPEVGAVIEVIPALSGG